MSRSGDVPTFEYVGTELDLFARAVNWKSYFATRLAPYVRGSVLEVGAGIGETTRQLCNGRQTSWLCLEPDPHLADRLGVLLRESALAPQPTIAVGTIADLPADSLFDAILYVDVLEHIGDDRRELQRARAHLTPTGAIVVLSPAFNLLFSEFDKSIGHHRRYTKRSLANVFPSGMRPRELTYLDSVGFLASLANRMMLRQSLPTSRQIAFWDGVLIPASRVVDPLFRRMFGRSVIAVYSAS
jgi:SAM-dependent methyltransferase